MKIDENTYLNLKSERWDEISSTDFYCLKKMGFIVNSPDEERNTILEKANFESKNGTHFNLHLLATTKCNFKCSYCFQDGVKSKSFSIDDIDVILASIVPHILESGIKSVSLVLYGGEPTLNWNFTTEFINNLTDILKKNSIWYETQIITNGYALDESKLSFLSSHNCQKIQITLDGCKEMHDSRRVLANGKPTFEKIINNIHIALDNNYIDKVSIRLNYDKQNLNDQIQLLDYLANEFDTSRILISLGWVTNAAKEPSMTVYTHESLAANKMHIDAYVSLYSHAKQLGFDMKRYYVYNGICISKRNNALLICSDGYYYKCGGLIGRKEHSVGEIGEPIIAQSYHYPDLYESCFEKKCEMIPLCHAGCRLEAFYSNGSLHTQDCKYDLVKGINQELLRINYGHLND